MNSRSTNNNVSDELLYEFVMDEMEQQSDPIKGLWAKATAHAEGNDGKAKALYMQYRVESIKEKLSGLQVDFTGVSKEELFETIRIDFAVLPEKVQILKEQKAVAEEKAIEVAIEEEAKKESEKYGKLGGWLIVLAIFIVLGILLGFLRVEHFFENENLDALKLLYQNGMDEKASLLNTITYMSFVSYGLLLAFTISFFIKDIFTKNLAILYFGSNIIAFPIVIYLLVKIDLPTISIMTGVIGGVMQTLFALIWLRYFMVSERVKKTFVNGNDNNYGMAALSVGLGAILFASILYANESAKNTLMAGQTAASMQTSSEAEPEARAMTVEEVANPKYDAEECDDGKIIHCEFAGNEFLTGYGVQKDMVKAAEYYKKACDGGNMNGCNFLAAVYRFETAVGKDMVKAAEYYKKACDGGQSSGCSSYEELQKQGY